MFESLKLGKRQHPHLVDMTPINNERSGIIFENPQVREVELQEQQRSRQLRLCLTVLLVGFLIFVIIDSLTSSRIKTISVQFLVWIEVHPWMGVLAVIAVYTIATSKPKGV